MRTFTIAIAACIAGCAAFASPISYTFTATTTGQDSHTQTFSVLTQDFLPVEQGMVSLTQDDPSVVTCVPCIHAPINALRFLRSGSDDFLQFIDANGTNYLYDFDAGAFTGVGTWTTRPGINVNRGTLVVTSTPEPSTVGLLLTGAAVLLGYSRRRRA